MYLSYGKSVSQWIIDEPALAIIYPHPQELLSNGRLVDMITIVFNVGRIGHVFGYCVGDIINIILCSVIVAVNRSVNNKMLI